MLKVDSTPDGVTSAEFPTDDRHVRVWLLPLGYQVESITHAGVDLTKSSLKVTSNRFTEIHIGLTTKSGVPLRNIRGRLVGSSPGARLRLILNAVASRDTFSATVLQDGAFSFSGVPEGVYAPSLEGAEPPLEFTPQVIVVRGRDTESLNVVASQRKTTDLASASTTGQNAGNELGRLRSKNEEEAILSLDSLNLALSVLRDVNNGRYGDIESLIAARMIDNNYRALFYGYRFFVIPHTNGYSAVAIPENSESGRYAYYTSRDRVVRYSTFAPWAPPGQNGNPAKRQ
jgi:hypothetical protein